MAVGDDFLTNPTSELFLDKIATGRPLPDGLSEQNVSMAGNWNAVKRAMDVMRSEVLLPLEAKGTPPENVVPNSAWQLMTVSGAGAKMQADASLGEEETIAVDSYSTSTNTAVCVTSNTKNLKVGDLVKFDSSAHANMQIAPMRVTAVVANASFNVGVPRGLTGGTTAACTCQPWDAGGNLATGDGPDGWTKTVGARVWREDNAVNLKAGSKYSCGFKKYASSRENMYVLVNSRRVDQMKGKSFVFGCGVKQGVKGGTGTWRVWINVDGNEYFSEYATVQTYQWREKTVDIPEGAAAVSYGIAFEGALSDVYYVSQPMAGLGDYIGEWNYHQPKNEIYIPIVQYNPPTMVGATVAITTALSGSDNTVAHGGGVGNQFGFKMRLPAESEGRIAPTVRAVIMQLEGKSTAATLDRSNAFVDLLLECTTGGTRGTAAFKVSADGGSTWSTIQTSGAGTGTMQWIEATYSADANNALVRYQPFLIGDGGTYTAGDRWTVTTAAVVTQTVAVGYNGVTITPRVQGAVLGLRSKESAPTVYGILLFAQVAGLMNGHAGWVTLDEFGDMMVYTGSLNTQWTSVSYDINGFLLS
jgi:hypothetical protein